jgi:LAO/AO transport system kinase
VNILIAKLRADGRRVGVLAVDPTSPFSGGAVLGDRVRMASAEGDPNVYIRSLGSRGSLGGVSSATAGIARVLEAFGVDIVLIETVGMGQTGFDIADISDTVALVLSPESGDGVQVMKAGVMEIADIYVVIKADRPGADALVAEMEMLVSSITGPGKWRPLVLKLSAKQNEGADELAAAFAAHGKFIAESGQLEGRRRRQAANEIKFLAEGQFKAFMDGNPQREKMLALADRILSGELDAYQAAERILWGAASQILNG